MINRSTMKINARQTAETYSLYAACRHFKASDRNKTERKNSTKKTINPPTIRAILACCRRAFLYTPSLSLSVAVVKNRNVNFEGMEGYDHIHF